MAQRRNELRKLLLDDVLRRNAAQRPYNTQLPSPARRSEGCLQRKLRSYVRNPHSTHSSQRVLLRLPPNARSICRKTPRHACQLHFSKLPHYLLPSMFTWVVLHRARWGSSRLGLWLLYPTGTPQALPGTTSDVPGSQNDPIYPLWKCPRASYSLATSFLPVCNAQSDATDTRFHSTQKTPEIELLV